ncbi:uracil phosphoribosyltransferase [Staphylothermus hellenicus]|uniref:Uracil phosphoribosyltransferase n=1 Tax=Staphylothermus hellenicus (strain DSM 12710 / JCM 10830 / BK20S6-10-b1 / P8) TaxID=591019 RepID=D7DC74_STAHD|nr:uracil phosphoribosyltransferase [Staphylothermus hellenicus]ADI31771.1 Uracil phosphoribosyltransferase [Staphylothermus hellenicus DSM 12710]
MRGDLVIVDNPLVKYYLTILRDHRTTPKIFRDYIRRLGFILGYEASRYLRWKKVFVETPLAKSEGLEIGKPVLIVGILGASIPMIEGIWDALPWAGLGLVAARRHEYPDRVEVDVYYERLPEDLSIYTILLIDPMLATGKTIVKVVKKLRDRKARDIIILTIISSKPGIEYIRRELGNIPIITVAIDPLLNDKFFIVPGLGDAGDRGLSHDYVEEKRV